jgi:hypothetical protein
MKPSKLVHRYRRFAEAWAISQETWHLSYRYYAKTKPQVGQQPVIQKDPGSIPKVFINFNSIHGTASFFRSWQSSCWLNNDPPFMESRRSQHWYIVGLKSRNIMKNVSSNSFKIGIVSDYEKSYKSTLNAHQTTDNDQISYCYMDLTLVNRIIWRKKTLNCSY